MMRAEEAEARRSKECLVSLQSSRNISKVSGFKMITLPLEGDHPPPPHLAFSRPKGHVAPDLPAF